jgi:hypothetical protein
MMYDSCAHPNITHSGGVKGGASGYGMCRVNPVDAVMQACHHPCRPGRDIDTDRERERYRDRDGDGDGDREQITIGIEIETVIEIEMQMEMEIDFSTYRDRDRDMAHVSSLSPSVYLYYMSACQ